ncbi:MAG: hypothetical protein ACE5HI_06345, partial [bacterium]
KPQWLFQCICGNQIITDLHNVRYGHTKSCGCLVQRWNHGMYKSKFYRVWYAIKSRCENKKNKAYHHYGGKGVKIEWESFLDFKNDMYETYLQHCKKFGQKNTTIERINSNEDYSKNNCRWATQAEQLRNTSRTHLITFRGKTMCRSDWSKKLGFPHWILQRRFELGWSIKEALTTPLILNYSHKKL